MSMMYLGIISIDDNQYLYLFESLIKANSYVESKRLINNIIARKRKLTKLVIKYENDVNYTSDDRMMVYKKWF